MSNLSAFPGHCVSENLQHVQFISETSLYGLPFPRIPPEEILGSKNSTFSLGIHCDPLTCFHSSD